MREQDAVSLATVSISEKTRYHSMVDWVASKLGEVTITPIVGDLSFRRYFRVSTSTATFILMDAPADVESSEPFIKIGQALREQGVRTPFIHHHDCFRGFLLLEDFGDKLLLPILNAENATSLYQKVLDSVFSLSRCDRVSGYDVPKFTRERYLAELAWFEQWYLAHFVKVTLTQSQKNTLYDMYELIIESALSQPEVLVHKDMHARNLMLLGDGDIGVIDFQDALRGPVTYDVMSLTYDHYIAWPYASIRDWVRYYYDKLDQSSDMTLPHFDEFMRWHDWLALQRIMKNLGNFVRAHVSLNKSRYLSDIPRIYQYIIDITSRYPALKPLQLLLNEWHPARVK